MPNPWVLIPLAAGMASALSALAILLRDPRHVGNRVATLLVGGASWWAFCQALWTMALDPGAAMLFHRLSALGWCWLGPLSLHLGLSVRQLPARRLRRFLPGAYAVSGLFFVLQLATPLLQHSPSAAPWGWSFESGPLQAVFAGYSVAGAIAGIFVALRGFFSWASPAERRQLWPLGLGIAMPLLIAPLTGALLPVLGIQAPRLGAVSFSCLGVAVAFGYYRYGFSAVVPGSFAREVIDRLPAGVALLRLDGTVRMANRFMAALLDVHGDELVGTRLGQRFDRPLPDDPAELRDSECKLATPSGEIPVGLSTSWVRDKEDLAIGVLLVVRDLREVVDLRNRLITSGRLAAVGQLAAGIAHEINNPTAYVRANLSQLRSAWSRLSKRLARTELDPELEELAAEGEELIDESIEGIERTAAIVRDVKGFAHGGTERSEPVDVNALLEDVLRMARRQLQDGVRIEVRLSDVRRVVGVPQELKQVFLNLVVNAVHAVGDEGTVRVSTALAEDTVVVRFEDDGCGITPEDRQRIFDPFFTTKPAGEGTGLGLAISYQIVRGHGAELTVDSEPGRGSCFSVRFPALVAGPPPG